MATPPVGGITPPTAPTEPTDPNTGLSPEDSAKIDELLNELKKSNPNIDKETVTKIYKELKKDNPNLKNMKVDDILKLIHEKSEKLITDKVLKDSIDKITKTFHTQPQIPLPGASPDEEV